MEFIRSKLSNFSAHVSGVTANLSTVSPMWPMRPVPHHTRRNCEHGARARRSRPRPNRSVCQIPCDPFTDCDPYGRTLLLPAPPRPALRPIWPVPLVTAGSALTWERSRMFVDHWTGRGRMRDRAAQSGDGRERQWRIWRYWKHVGDITHVTMYLGHTNWDVCIIGKNTAWGCGQ